METKVTIIVPIFKAENYIDKCLQSLQNQTYKNIEYLLVDDGSPDNCPEICEAYAARDSRIKVIHHKNAGASKARENGLQQATGEFVTFVDPDDWIELNTIEEMLSVAEKYNADMVISDWKVFGRDYPEGLIVSQPLLENASLDEIREGFLLDRLSNFLCNKLYRRSLFKGIQFPDRMLYEDLYIHAELICRCRNVRYIKKAFYCYRIHASTANTSSKIKEKEGLYKAWREHERVCEFYKIPGPLPYCRLRTQQAAISLLTLNCAEHQSDPALLTEAETYLTESETNPAEGLSLSNKLEWWALKHVPFLSGLSGKIHIWADLWQQKRKYG